jgi:serine/threonine protein phosphatase PrpC
MNSKVINPTIQTFNTYSANVNNISKVPSQRSNTAGITIPRSSRIPQNNQKAFNTIYNNYHYQSSERKNNYINYTPETNANQVVNNIKTINGYQLDENNKLNNNDITNNYMNNQIYDTKNVKNINDTYMNIKDNPQDMNTLLINNDSNNPQYSKTIEEANNSFLNGPTQTKIDQRANVNPQFANSGHLQSTTNQLNNNSLLSTKNKFSLDNIGATNDLRYSLPQSLNSGFYSFKNKNFDYFGNTYTTTKGNTPRKEQEEIDKIIRSSYQGYQPSIEIISDNNEKEYYRECLSGLVKSYAYYEDQNVRNRDYMEDQGKSVENLGGDQNKMLFCLFDGHGGGEVSKFLQEYFHTYMKQLLPFDDYFKGFLNLFRLLDEKIKSLNVPTMGSTGTVVFIEKIRGKKIIYCANVGDSRCILVNRKEVMRMSYDDRVDDPKENGRIISSGGVIVNGRVYGTLMLSRSFGDWAIKSYGVIVDPHITKIEVTDDDLFLIIASDGVWDVIKDGECKQFYGNSKNTLDLCKNIVAESLKRGSQDNISCFAISFK